MKKNIISSAKLLSPEIEAYSENSLSAEDAACICCFFVVYNCDIKLAECAEEKTMIGAIPHNRQLQTVI